MAEEIDEQAQALENERLRDELARLAAQAAAMDGDAAGARRELFAVLKEAGMPDEQAEAHAARIEQILQAYLDRQPGEAGR